MTDTVKKKGLSRRSVLKGTAAAAGLAVGSGAITGFPTIWAQSNITLRQFGTGVSNLNAIAERCTEVETGARNVDHILTGTLLPRISTEILQRLSAGGLPERLRITLDDKGEFAFGFGA